MFNVLFVTTTNRRRVRLSTTTITTTTVFNTIYEERIQQILEYKVPLLTFCCVYCSLLQHSSTIIFCQEAMTTKKGISKILIYLRTE